ncbi:hypothetical protein [Aquimarina rubra]|uniref:GLPGLI family protein n=1 Tax=Aquimarina rubra TaxID=1920033 RepID=A0ABW5LBI5_9FLAO
MIKKIVLLTLILSSLKANAQQITVFYKEKRQAAQVSKQESVDHSEINSFVQDGLAKFKATHKPGAGKDSINLYNQKFLEEADRLFSIVKEKQEKEQLKNAPLTIPSYDYITILKVNKDTSLYYPQEKVTNDTISRIETNEAGRELVDEKINYNDSEIIYLNISQRKKNQRIKGISV